jgi:hypothetical protein
LVQEQQLQYGPSFKQLDVLVQPQTADRLYVKIAPEGQQRWTVPEYIVPRYVMPWLTFSGSAHTVLV